MPEQDTRVSHAVRLRSMRLSMVEQRGEHMRIVADAADYIDRLERFISNQRSGFAHAPDLQP